MELKEILLTSITDIDSQHAHFLKLIENLETLLKRKYLKNELEELIMDISNYARKHFDTEEKYLNKYKYPKKQEHELQHIELLSKINIFYDGLLYSNTNPKDFQDFLLDWFENHLKKQDKQYVDYFKKIKIKEPNL
jgi:hemerythrin